MTVTKLPLSKQRRMPFYEKFPGKPSTWTEQQILDSVVIERIASSFLLEKGRNRKRSHGPLGRGLPTPGLLSDKMHLLVVNGGGHEAFLGDFFGLVRFSIAYLETCRLPVYGKERRVTGTEGAAVTLTIDH